MTMTSDTPSQAASAEAGVSLGAQLNQAALSIRRMRETVADVVEMLNRHGGACTQNAIEQLTFALNAAPASPPAEALPESTAEKLLRRFIHHERGIMADLRTAHSNRGPGASSFMREDDRDQYEALEKLFGEARTALTLAAEDR